MLRNLKEPTRFYHALRAQSRIWLGLSEEEFERKWKSVDASFDQDGLSMTSLFNIDTSLISCAEEIFPALKNKRPDIERLFFEVRGEYDFGPHLIGREMDWLQAVGGRVKIIGVSLTERLGMGYRFKDTAGNIFQVEKFD